jgi:peptide/nickel transport system substrate-binding protein
MVDRRTKLRWRRIVRRRRRQAEDIGSVTEDHIDRHLVRRLTKLVYVRRFLIGWLGLVVILIIGVLLQSRALTSKYQVKTPVAGGIYTEGVLGTFTNANPVYATNLVDSSVSKLVFSSLLKYNEKGELVGDLADTYALDPTETLYTVKLRKGVTWHDGKQFTAKDVVFTYNLIQNPEAKSPLAASWRGIKVAAVDDSTVQFKLPNKLSAFPHSLTNGIIPEHVLSKVNASQLRSNSFNNQSPVGTGPFEFKNIEVMFCDKCERLAGMNLLKQLRMETASQGDFYSLTLTR